jgi:hypothetical protein
VIVKLFPPPTSAEGSAITAWFRATIVIARFENALIPPVVPLSVADASEKVTLPKFSKQLLQPDDASAIHSAEERFAVPPLSVFWKRCSEVTSVNVSVNFFPLTEATSAEIRSPAWMAKTTTGNLGNISYQASYCAVVLVQMPSVPVCSTERLVTPSRPIQKESSFSGGREGEHEIDGWIQLPFTSLNDFARPVSAYPDQLEDMLFVIAPGIDGAGRNHAMGSLVRAFVVPWAAPTVTGNRASKATNQFARVRHPLSTGEVY